MNRDWAHWESLPVHLNMPSGHKIRINDLSLSVLLKGGSCWESKNHELQPVLISFAISFDVRKVAETDALCDTIDYASFSSEVTGLLSAGCYDSLETLSDSIFKFAFHSRADVVELDVEVVQTKAPLHTKLVGYACSRSKGKTHILERYFVSDLICPAIIGVNLCERNERQDICLNLSVERSDSHRSMAPFDYRGLTRIIYDVRQCLP